MSFAAWAVLLASMALRSLGVNRPLLGNFAMYQSIYAAMAKFFAGSRFQSFLYPEVYALSQGKPGLMLLFYPVSSLLAGMLYFFFGGSLAFWGRLQSILFFGAAGIYLYRLVKTLIDPTIAFWSLIGFCLLPLTIIYGQSFQNEMATIFFSLLFFFHLVCWMRRGGLFDFVVSILGLTGTLLTRPNLLYVFIPAFYLCFFVEPDCKTLRGKILGTGFVSLGGFLFAGLWYWHTWHVSNTASNIYSTMYAQLGLHSVFISPLVLSLGYYRDLWDVLAGMALTPIGVTLLAIGIFRPEKHYPWQKRFFLLWSAVALLSLLLIPRKPLEHSFYLLPAVVSATPLMAFGFMPLIQSLKSDPWKQKAFVALFLTFAFLVSLRYAWNPAFKTPDKDRPLLEIAKQVQSVTSRESSRILVQGSHVVLYYADRFGWGFQVWRQGTIPNYLEFMNWQKLSPEQRRFRNEALKNPRTSLEYFRDFEGATHFVMSDPEEFSEAADFAHYMDDHYDILLEEKGKYAIFDLTHPKRPDRIAAVK